MKRVEAAGGVVLGRRGRAEVLIVHRPRYDDWTLPKGKLDRGESFEDAAVREVWEETGLRCKLGRELAGTEYRDNKDRPKVVRYWLMEPEASPGTSSPTTRWTRCAGWRSEEAAGELTYDRDREVLEPLRDG